MEPTRVLLRLPAGKVRKLLAAALPAQAEATPVPDPLIHATLRAAARVTQGESAAGEALSSGVRGLVDDALWALASRRWDVGPT